MYQTIRNPDQWHEHPSELHPKIDIDSVLATQSLAVQLAKRQSRSVQDEPGLRLVFALNAVDNMILADGVPASDNVDEYMTCRLVRDQPDKWDMTVRFRQNKRQNVSEIDEYGYTWLDDGELRAWHAQYDVIASYGKPTVEDWKSIDAITDDTSAEMHDRMRLHSLRGRLAIAATDKEENRMIRPDRVPIGDYTPASILLHDWRIWAQYTRIQHG